MNQKLLLLIDGQNVILSEPQLESLFDSQPSSPAFLPDCRHWLQSHLQAMTRVGIEIVIVYDYRQEREREWRGLTTIFTKAGVEADQIILDLARQSAKNSRIALVSSDKELREAVKNLGALVIWSPDFSKLLLYHFSLWFQADPWSVLKTLAWRGIKGLLTKEEGQEMARDEFVRFVELHIGENVRFQAATSDSLVYRLLAEQKNPYSAYLMVYDRRSQPLTAYQTHQQVLSQIESEQKAAQALENIAGMEEEVKRHRQQAVELEKALPPNLLIPQGRAKAIYRTPSPKEGRRFPELVLEDLPREVNHIPPLWLLTFPATAISCFTVREGCWKSPLWIGKPDNRRYAYLVIGEGPFVDVNAREGEVPGLRLYRRVEGQVEEIFFPDPNYPLGGEVIAAILKAVEKRDDNANNGQTTEPVGVGADQDIGGGN